jgi:hypothetical protein
LHAIFDRGATENSNVSNDFGTIHARLRKSLKSARRMEQKRRSRVTGFIDFNGDISVEAMV